MSIPESQLETWAHQGSVTQSAATYNTIKNVLEAAGTPYAAKAFTVFLQGSHGNDTNIFAESDVDIVIRLDDLFFSDLSQLSAAEQTAYHSAYSNATYTYANFKNDVVNVLRKQYGNAAKAGEKAIAIEASGSRRKADVIVAAQFRRYWKFNNLYDETYDEGICFFNGAGERIANYPKQHSQNLTAKHRRCNGWFKPLVRVLKNLRGKLVSDGLLKPGAAPSYYLEGLLHNVPDDCFGGSYQESFACAFDWLHSADKSKLVCANGQYYLMRDGLHTCWPTANALLFLNAATKLWEEW